MGKAAGRHARKDGRAQTENAPDAALSRPASPEPSGNADAARPSVARSATLMGAATLMSRVTGLIRTWAMAYALGNTLITSAYQVANTLPNAIYDLVAGGLLGTAFIPIFLLQRERYGDKEGNEFACNILSIIIVVMGALAVLASIFAPQVIATQTFTVDDEAQVTEYAILFFRIFAAQILFYGVGGVLEGILNANRVYFLPALAPVFNNILTIISFFSFVPLSSIDETLAIVVLAAGTSLGVFVQMALQIPALKKANFKFRFKIDLHDPALVEALKIAFPTFVYIVGTLISYSFRNAFSLQTGDNGPSTLSYAWTWFQLPYGVVAVSLSRTLFTEMSHAVAQEDWESLRELVRRGISTTLLFIIPLAGLMGSLATPLMQLFQAGAFSAEDAAYVGSILALWVVSLPFYSVLRYLHNVFASMRRFVTYAVVSCVMVVVQCALYAFLCQDSLLGLAGIPVADLVYYGGCCIAMLVVLYRRIGSFHLMSILGTALRVLAATAVGVAACYGLSCVLPVTSEGMLTAFITIVVCGCVGLVVIFGLCALFRVPEMEAVTSLLKRLLGKLRREKRDDDPGEPPADPPDDQDLPPDATGAIMARAKHADQPDDQDLPPDATGAIMARAKHVK